MSQAGRLRELAKKYDGKVEFVAVYVREAHGADTHRAQPQAAKVREATTIEDRLAAARRTAAEMKLGFPMLVDDMENSVATAYAAHPNRFYIIGKDGRVAHVGPPGPEGFSVRRLAGKLWAILKKQG